MFSSFVDVPVKFLPDEARLIHAECKGSPMVISMIGGLISETGRHQQKQRQSGRWAYYLSNLKSRRYSEKCYSSTTAVEEQRKVQEHLQYITVNNTSNKSQ